MPARPSKPSKSSKSSKSSKPSKPSKPSKSSKSTAKETLRLTLDVASTPERVRQIATMFDETLRQIAPELREGDVTMVVENYTAAAEVRGWHDAGEQAVRSAAELVDNATEAVQEHHELATAARTLANHAAALAPYGPQFWRGSKPLRRVDDVFVRTMRAAGTAPIPRERGVLTGETVVHTCVLRVGKKYANGKLQARVRVEGRFLDVDVADGVAAFAWELAQTGEVCPVRLRGQWLETGDGGLQLSQPEIIGIDTGHVTWSGQEVLDAARDNAHLFSTSDFERMLSELQPTQGEE